MSQSAPMIRLTGADLINKLYAAAGALIAIGALFLIIFAIAVDDAHLGAMTDSRGSVVAISALLVFFSILTAVVGWAVRGTPGAIAVAVLAFLLLVLYLVLQWQFRFMDYHRVLLGGNSAIQMLGTFVLLLCIGGALARRYQPSNLALRLALAGLAVMAGLVYAIEFLLIMIGGSTSSPLGDAFSTRQAVPVLFAVVFALGVYAILALCLWACLPNAPVRRLFTGIAGIAGALLLGAALCCLVQFIIDLAEGTTSESTGFYVFKLMMNLVAGFGPALGVAMLTTLGIGNGLAAAVHLSRTMNWSSLGSVMPGGSAAQAGTGQVAAPAAQLPHEEVVQRLKRLDRLHADGMLTPEEYQRKRQELIAHL